MAGAVPVFQESSEIRVGLEPRTYNFSVGKPRTKGRSVNVFNGVNRSVVGIHLEQIPVNPAVPQP